ncbi:MAG: NUDIX domain-containing protein [Nitrospinae bacterium]|nr:NUDIX domain-containing protein [Nitrospinota bacterium]
MLCCVHAILLVKLNFALQLRDNDPTIPASGQWSLFGGGIEGTETPKDAIIREIKEELSVTTCDFEFLGCVEYYCSFKKEDIHISFFVADITPFWGTHHLTEGQDVQFFSFEKIPELKIPEIFRELIYNFHNKKVIPICGSCSRKK